MQWLLSWGRRPIRRELPDQRLVLLTRRLRSAQRRLPAVRISERQRRQLADVLDAATDAAEQRLRNGFRPKLEATLDEVGLRSQNFVEDVSRRKLVEELLDRIAERGFLTLGEVRDAVSRNNLKLPDCGGLGDFLHGDAVLRLDRRLAVAMDGVYERGDFYQRWIQRFSLLAFGTVVGRWLTRYVAIPYGGAVVVLVVAEHLAAPLTGGEEFYAPTFSDWRSYGPTLLVGSFLVGLIHVPWFRDVIWDFLKHVGLTARLVFFDSFRWFFGLPLVRRIVHSAVVVFLFRYVVKAGAPTLVLWQVLPRRLATWPMMIELAAIFLLLDVLINSRLGRILEESLVDWCVESWHRIGVRFAMGLFWWIVDLFRRLMQGIERVMYAVDEWLRFRSGQSRLMLVAKGAMGVVWFFIAYAVRFCVNLLIEPQLNPVKHIPWVTVSHKIMAPIWIAMGLHKLLAQHMNAAMADVATFLIVTLTPGIFGYLIWELKENWRLFAANRPPTLGPVLVGSHGESLPRLLRPGLHSGTIPKRFARLRRAERKAIAAGSDPQAARKQRELLHHAEIDVRRYFEREFIAWFRESRAWQLVLPRVEEIHVATNSIAVDLALPGAVEGPLLMTLALIGGRLRLELTARLCAADLAESAHGVLRAAIVNVLKTGGVELLDHSGMDGPDDVVQQRGIRLPEVTWDEWIAVWEAAGRGPTPDPHDWYSVI